jgi:hypothetical protein
MICNQKVGWRRANAPAPAQEIGAPMHDAGYCECGCGQKAALATRTRSAQGLVKGQPVRFLPGHRQKLDAPRPIERFERNIKIEPAGYVTPCWLWTGITTTNGYGQLAIGGSRTKIAHKWRWEYDHGPLAADLQLDHLCKNRSCANPSHLEPVSGLENARRSRSAKLTQEQAVEIHRRRLAGENAKRLGAEFGVGKDIVYMIARNGPYGPREPKQNARHRATTYPSKRDRYRSRGTGT